MLVLVENFNCLAQAMIPPKVGAQSGVAGDLLDELEPYDGEALSSLHCVPCQVYPESDLRTAGERMQPPNTASESVLEYGGGDIVFVLGSGYVKDTLLANGLRPSALLLTNRSDPK